jgi:two-component system sensor histidine kinase ChvG
MGRLAVRWLRSVRVQGCGLAVILIVLPALIFAVLANADAERRQLILRAVEETGDAVSAGLAPVLHDLHPADFATLGSVLSRFSTGDRSIRILFRPTSGRATSGRATSGRATSGQAAPEFYLIATEPPVPPQETAAERQQLLDLAILPDIATGCDARFLRGHDPSLLDNGTQVLTAVRSVDGVAGCWTIVIANGEGQVLGAAAARPYWARPEVQLAIAIYVLMAVLIAAMFAGIWRDLLRFRRLALSPTDQSGFARLTDTPELAPLASAFDQMVQRLRRSAEMLRQAAEDNAHAFKGPISTIRIAIEPPPRRGGSSDGLLPGALKTVAAALDRLDGLVRSARVLDTAVAELLEPQYERVDLSALVRGFVAGHAAMHAGREVGFEARVADGITMPGQPEMLETILETLVDNAISFSPEGGLIVVGLAVRGDEAVLTVDDAGPGILPDCLERVFERYYTHRPADRAASGSGYGTQHFGIGLWLARQNTVALGGRISVANRQPHGLRVTVVFPSAKQVARHARGALAIQGAAGE